jgi:hypothetical protein
MPDEDTAITSANNHPQGGTNRRHSLDAFRGMVVLWCVVAWMYRRRIFLRV